MGCDQESCPSDEEPTVCETCLFAECEQAFREGEETAQAEVKRLEADVTRLQADARRYAYIRDCLVQSHSHQMNGTATYHVRMIYGRAGTFDELVDGKIEEAVVEGYTPDGATEESPPDGSQG